MLYEVITDTTNRVNTEAACLDCHAVTVAYPAFTDSGDNKKHDACSTCHTSATDLTLVPNASAGAGGGALCTTCHTGRVWTDHSIDHSGSGYVTLAANCNTCHIV